MLIERHALGLVAILFRNLRDVLASVAIPQPVELNQYQTGAPLCDSFPWPNLVKESRAPSCLACKTMARCWIGWLPDWSLQTVQEVVEKHRSIYPTFVDSYISLSFDSGISERIGTAHMLYLKIRPSMSTLALDRLRCSDLTPAGF